MFAASAPLALDLPRLRLLLLGAMGLPLIAAGCGDDKKDPDTGGGLYGDGGGGDGGTDGTDGTDGSDGTDGTDGTDGGGGDGCADAESLVGPDGAPNGYERCPDGAVNRASAEPVGSWAFEPACAGDETFRDCTTDADCTAAPNGHCTSGTGIDTGETYCACTYGCETDADCADGSVCLPPGVVDTGFTWPTCQPASCVTNADCDSGECGVSSYDNGCGFTVQLSCRSEADACRTDADCDPSLPDCGVNWGSGGLFVCNTMDCAIGRPLHDAEQAIVVAPSTRRVDWAAGFELAPPADPALAAALAAHWTGVAAMEHASVASFSRAALQLLQLGAPPSLLAQTHAAALDEVRHAQLAYGLASAFAGAPVGPGPLSLQNVVLHADRAQVVWDLVVEACVGETVGAAEARAAALGCVDPALKAALLGVAEDEERHAALGWATLRWLLAGAGPALRAQAAAALEDGARAVLSGADAPAPSGAAAFGLLGGPDRQRLRARVVDAVVRPCMDALLGAAA
jgi:hypothetical protein